MLDGIGMCCWVLLRGEDASRKEHTIVALYHMIHLVLEEGRYRRWGWRRIPRLQAQVSKLRDKNGEIETWRNGECIINGDHCLISS